MTAHNETPEGGKNVAKRTEKKLGLETVNGDLAVIVTVTGMGHDSSPVIIEHVEEAIRSELGHMVRDDI